MRVRLVGASWTRLAPYKAYIPLGPPGSPDSHTTYAARAFPDPKDPEKQKVEWGVDMASVSPHALLSFRWS